MKKFILSMLFGLFALTSFATTHEVKKEVTFESEQSVKAIDFVLNDAVNSVNYFKVNIDAVIIDNSVNLYWKMWQHYFYSEKLSENYNLQFKDRIYNGSIISIRN